MQQRPRTRSRCLEAAKGDEATGRLDTLILRSRVQRDGTHRLIEAVADEIDGFIQLPRQRRQSVGRPVREERHDAGGWMSAPPPDELHRREFRRAEFPGSGL